jgi:hypothetical protein
VRRRSSLLLLAWIAFDIMPARAAVGLIPRAANGLAGEQITIAVVLSVDGGEQVAGAQCDLVFDALTPVAAGADGRPLCSVDPQIDKSATSFAFQPARCGPASQACRAVRAVVIAFDNVDPIEPGAVLFRCEVAIAPDATPAAYPLVVLPGRYAPPTGGDRPAGGGAAVIQVGASPPTAVPTWTAAAPTPTFVWTPTLPVPTATAVVTSTATAVTPTLTTPVPTVVVPQRPGDVNCDAVLSSADIYAAVASVFAPTLRCDADCNGDKRVDVADLACVTRAVAAGSDAIKSQPGASLPYDYGEPASFPAHDGPGR